MATNSPYTLKLPAKTETSDCYWYTKGVRGDCPNPTQLLNSYSGQVVVDAQTLQATFYSPSEAECSDPIKNAGCKLEAHLPYASLEKLTLDNISFRKHLESLGIIFNPPIPDPPKNSSKGLVEKGEDATKQGNLGSLQDSQGHGKHSFFDPLVQHGPAILGTFFIAIFGYFVIKKVESMLQVSSRKSSRRAIIQEQPLASSSGSSLPSVQALYNIVSEEIKRQLFPFHDELKNLRSQVKLLEDKLDLIGLSQELQASVAKPKRLFPEPISHQVSFNTHVPIQPAQPIPPLPPAPLSVDLIKKAVSSGDYNLISSHPHFFLSETSESQQGLGDGKRFTIDGDQSQASSRTQSEFIAINCNDETYLIPNIVPNAADPARTLKRHADKNNIYRNGQGSVLLNLNELAVVERNGERFELIKAGQIA